MKIRSLLAVALLVPAVAFAAPAGKAAASSGSGDFFNGLQVGGFVGYETDDFSGLSLRLDGEVPFKALSPQVNLSWVGSFGYSRLSFDYGFADFGVNANIIKIIPAARFSFPLNKEVTLFADGGLGFYYASLSVDSTFPGASAYENSEFSLMMRIGGGLWYQLNPQTKIGAMLEFDPYFGDLNQSTFLIQGGAMFRM